MRWTHKETVSDPWEKHFVIFPVKIGGWGPREDGDVIVWLEWVWRRICCSHHGQNLFEYRLNHPNKEKQNENKGP